ncbi:glycosyltransferase, partial [Mycobacterium tuberculosis]|nr:glycosyltransferase [Mycobacterium tuberculosis]
YGGPTTVAFNQCRALADAGHDVVLAATGSGLGTPLPTERDGVRTALFPPHFVLPGAGFAGLTSPAMLSWVHRVAPSADVVHVHMA